MKSPAFNSIQWSLALAATAMLALASAGRAQNKGILGDDLSDLQKSVDGLAGRKIGPTDVVKPATMPAEDIRPTVNTKTGILGDDLADLEKKVGGLQPPRVGDQPPVVVKPATQPFIQHPPDAASNIVPEQWFVRADKSASIKDREILLASAGKHGAATATFNAKLAGDFELRVESSLSPAGPADQGKAELSRGFGIRLESDANWKESRLLSVDRTADKEGDILLAAHSDQIEPPLIARPKGSNGAIRIQRQGDRFRVAYRDENATRWTGIGDVDAKMSPKLELWLTTYVTGGEIRATVKRVEVLPQAR